MRKSSQLSFHDHRMRSGQGGPRKGSGRKPSGRNCDPKRRREAFAGWKPVHLTLRVREGLPNLRQALLLEQLRASFGEACDRPDFRLVHYSVQSNHFHLIVEAKDQQALGRGMKSIGARIARPIALPQNKTCSRAPSGPCNQRSSPPNLRLARKPKTRGPRRCGSRPQQYSERLPSWPEPSVPTASRVV